MAILVCIYYYLYLNPNYCIMSIGTDIEKAIKLATIVLIISIPLSIWKLINIVMWIIKHIKITID